MAASETVTAAVSSPSGTWPVKRKHVLVLVACVQNFLCAGLLFGWAAISSTVLLAPTSEGGAGLDHDYTHSIFVVGSALNFMAPLVLGIILDVAGPRTCSALSLLLVMVGLIVFGASSSEFDGFMAGMALVAIGGPGVQSSIIHLSNLFPKQKATTTAVLTGCFALSFVVFLVFDQLWYRLGWTFRSIFLGYSAVVGVCLVLTLFLMPDKPFALKTELRKSVEAEPQLAIEYADKTERDFEYSKLRLPSVYRKTGNFERVPSVARYGQSPRAPPKPSPRSLKDESLINQLLSGEFIRVTILLSVASFWANFYIGVIDTQLGDEAFVTRHTEILAVQAFTAFTTVGGLCTPLVGFLMDHLGFPATAVIMITLGVSFAALVLIKSVAALLTAFVCYALFRNILFTYFFGYMGDALGFRFFGVLSGVSFFIAGLLGVLQYPLSSWGSGTCHLQDDSVSCDQGNWRSVNLVQLVCLALLYALPFWDIKQQRRAGATDSPGRGMLDSPIVSREALERNRQAYQSLVPSQDPERQPLRPPASKIYGGGVYASISARQPHEV